MGRWGMKIVSQTMRVVDWEGAEDGMGLYARVTLEPKDRSSGIKSVDLAVGYGPIFDTLLAAYCDHRYVEMTVNRSLVSP
jgi:hypothetical protein